MIEKDVLSIMEQDDIGLHSYGEWAGEYKIPRRIMIARIGKLIEFVRRENDKEIIELKEENRKLLNDLQIVTEEIRLLKATMRLIKKEE